MKDKIRALLALAFDPSAAPGEADNASRMAAKLMAKHNLTLADLEEEALREEYDLTVGAARACRPGKKDPRKVPPWIGIIAWGVKIYTRTRIEAQHDRILFKGPRQDVELAVWMHNVILDNAYRTSQGQESPNAFRNGYAAAIQGRLKEMSSQRGAVDSEEGTALVVVNTRREEILNKEFGPESEGWTREIAQTPAGREAGNRAPIPTARPISPTASSLRLN